MSGLVDLEFASRVDAHRARLQRRGFPLWAEAQPPRGQAGFWYDEAIRSVPPSGRAVARQLARLCGDDSRVVISWRSLADAVGRADASGRLRAYTERGAQALTQSGWLAIVTTGAGRGARTTFLLTVGDHMSEHRPAPSATDLIDAAA